MSEGALLKKLIIFSAKCFIIFFQHPWKNYFLPIQDFYRNNELMKFYKYNFYCKASKNSHAFFILQKKVLVSSIGHHQTHWKFFRQNYLSLFFYVCEKCVFYEFKIFISTIHWCWQIISLISLKYLKICISEIFMRPRFLLTTLYVQSKNLPQKLNFYLDNICACLHDLWWTFCQNFRSLAVVVWNLWCFEDLEGTDEPFN